MTGTSPKYRHVRHVRVGAILRGSGFFIDVDTFHYPEDPCTVYLPTFTINLSQMWVNIPYMDPMGYVFIGFWSKVGCISCCTFC